MVRVRKRIGHRQLRPVRDAEHRDLVDAERLPDGLDVLGMIVRPVEETHRPELVSAGADDLRRLLRVGRGEPCQARAAQRA